MKEITTDEMRKAAEYGVDSYARKTLRNAASQLDALKAELDEEKQRSDGYGSACAESEAKLTASQARVESLTAAITRALADSESGEGWGPDVTVCGYLRQALAGAGDAHGS